VRSYRLISESKGIEKPSVVCEPRERISDGQMMHAFVGALVFGDFGSESHGGNGHDADEGLQQEQRSVLAIRGKRGPKPCVVPQGSETAARKAMAVAALRRPKLNAPQIKKGRKGTRGDSPSRRN